MPGNNTTTNETINRTELPEWVNNAGKANYDESVAIGAKPQWSGSRVADFTPTMTQALSYIKDNAGAGSGSISRASSMFSDMGDPSKVMARTQSYMNPYVSEVVDKSMGDLESQRLKALATNADAATKARSFGGTRSAVVDAVTNSETAKQAGILSAALRKEGFDTAMTSQRNDAAQSAQGLLSAGDLESSNYLKTIQALMQGATTDQNMAQSKLDDTIGQFEGDRNRAIENLNLRMSTLGMTPYNKSSTSSSTTTAPNSFDPASLIVGLLSLGLGAF